MADTGGKRSQRSQVLIVDDSRTQRLLLRTLLRGKGYEVIEAEDGLAALSILRERPIRLVITDWMMPGLTGPELCARIRTDERDDGNPRAYVLLLTAKQDRQDVALGLRAGADDFLTKPVDETELIARLMAGERIVTMQDSLIQQRTKISETLEELRAANRMLERDLETASLLQAEFVPPEAAVCNGAPCGVVFRSSGHVGGDLVGYFPVGERAVGLYSVDVCGHGVAAALRAVHLSQLLSARDPSANVAFAQTVDGPKIRAPAKVMAELNERFIGAQQAELYFTMVLAVLDLETGVVRFCQAGHSPPAVLQLDGKVRFCGTGGPPVGLLPDMPYAEAELRLGPGERLMLYSDGLPEAERPDGTLIDGDGLASLLADHRQHPPDVVLRRLVSRVQRETGCEKFDDDISAILIERSGYAAAGAESASSSAIEASNTPNRAARSA